MCWSWDNIDWGATGAWAQAVGTFVAIWAAGRFGAKDRLDRQAEAMAAFYGIVEEVLAAITEAAGEAENVLLARWPSDTWNARFSDLEQFLRDVSVFELGAPEGASLIAKLLTVIATLKAHMANPPLQHALEAGRPVARVTFEAAAWIKTVRGLHEMAVKIAGVVDHWRWERDRMARRWWWPSTRMGGH